MLGLHSYYHVLLATYHLGTSFRDIGNALIFLGVPGVHEWHGIYHARMNFVNDEIIELFHDIVAEGMQMETDATIRLALEKEKKYSKEENE